MELFTVLAWFIWCRRNKCHFNEPSLPPEKLLDATSNTLAEFQTKRTDRQTQHKPATPRWQPQPRDTYKINYDSAVFMELDEAGTGVVVRNEMGEVMSSLAEKIFMPSSVGALEAMATRRAIIFAMELGFHRCIIEGDSKIVFKALTRDFSDRSSFGHTVKDCKFIIGSLQTCSFSHVRRQGNAVAHALVRRAKKSSPLYVQMESHRWNLFHPTFLFQFMLM